MDDLEKLKPLEPPRAVQNAARTTDDEPTKYAQNRVLRTVGGGVVAIGSLAIAGVLVWRDAPVTAWATALLFALTGCTIIEPTMLMAWLRPKGED